jgi:hypothetical protein
VKLVRVLLAALAALAIGAGVQVATSSGASAACIQCWSVIGDD